MKEPAPLVRALVAVNLSTHVRRPVCMPAPVCICICLPVCLPACVCQCLVVL